MKKRPTKLLVGRFDFLVVRITKGDSRGSIDLASDVADLHFDVLLAMASTTLAVLTATELLDKDLFAFGFTKHFGRNRSTFNGWLAELESRVARNGQHSIKF